MLHLTLRQLRVFEAVASSLSYSRAAESLFLTQPAVSMQIKQLEEVTGVNLFEQLGKKIFLTEAGSEFHHYSRNILQQLQDAENRLAELKGMGSKLTISVASTASYIAPKLLAEFCQRHPQTKASMNVTNRESLLNQLAQNEVGLAIMGQPPDKLKLEATSFMQNQLVVIAPADHPLAEEHSIPLSRLQQETFLIREQGSGTRVAMERFFAEQDIELTTGSEMSTNEGIKQAVQAGMGLGILSLDAAALEIETGRLRVLKVQAFPIMRHWYIVYRKGKKLSSTEKAFKEFLIQEASL
ncbi:MAG TPA: LysR family transcriptional regulator [Methylophilaceae bacterium]|jgi:DNA-binding transcriptional LysR family regulator